MTVKIYNTLTRQKEEFIPNRPGHVAMYVCGPNLYDPCHVGHAFSYIFFDTVKRYLRFRGYQVRHVQNFTDIEDRIIKKAQEEKITVHELAEKYIARFFSEMDALNIERADAYPRATTVIPQIIRIIQDLIEKDYAYVVDGDVYFRVRKDKDYGKLSHRSLDEMKAGARIQIDERKEDPMDFALWKASKPDEPAWESPWGKGRPGWHIECSAMNYTEHGPQIDIHGGGQDVIFPHHDNEIAQSESFTGKKPFSRYWMHNALLRLKSNTKEEKMTRHLGNTLWVSEALDRHEPDAIRLYLLSTHYRTPVMWSDDDIDGMARGLKRIRAAVQDMEIIEDAKDQSSLTQFANNIYEKFIIAMDDDFGTPQAIAALYELAHEINHARSEGMSLKMFAPAQKILRELTGVLGLTLKEPVSEAIQPEPFIKLLIEIRKELRDNKQYALADKIRKDLSKLGIFLKDSSFGTTWKIT